MPPQGEVLFVTPHAFWLERAWNSTHATTLQAFRSGVFVDAWCVDAGRQRWPIVSAQPVRTPSLLHRLLPWRRFPVKLTLGPVEPAQLGSVVHALCDILADPESDFAYDSFTASPEVLQHELRHVSSLEALFSVVSARSKQAT